MHVVSLSLDPHILNPESVVAQRNIRYGEVVSMFTILVPSASAKTVVLSQNVVVEGIAGPRPLQFLRLYCRLVALVQAGRCDVISAQDTYFLALVGYLVARRFHKGLEVQVLGVEKLSPLRKRLAQAMMRRAGSIRILSKRLWTRMETEFGIVSDRMRLVPIYVDVSSLGFASATADPAFEAATEAFKKTYAHHFNFLTVCRLVTVKNLPLMLRAFAGVVATHPEALLHIVGDGPLREELEATAATLGLRERVIFHGHQTGIELSARFKGADAFVLSSDSEGWGMVIVEAALAGLPIVMTDVGCAGEVIIDEVSGLVVPVGDEAALRAAMDRMCTDTSFRARAVQEAKKAVDALPSFEELLKDYKMSWQQAYTNSY